MTSGGESGRRLTSGGLAARIALHIAIGIPLVAIVWETLNELIAGRVVVRHLLLAIPGLLLLWLLLRLLGRAIQQWDQRLHSDLPTKPMP